jgi:N-acetylneuraminate synthase
MPEFRIGDRWVGEKHPPLVMAEIGINHEGDMGKARRMIDDAHLAGCECVKFQSHVIEDEMIPNNVIPGNATESIWDIMARCALSGDEERELKAYAEDRGLLWLCTPFSRAAADRLSGLDLAAWKIGSGECNNYPLIRHIASFGRPVLLSTGMNDIASIRPAVSILRDAGVPFALFHCTSMYPTPYDKVRLGAFEDLATAFPDAVLGLSDHSLGNYTCFAAIPLGARLLEKHFTSDKSWRVFARRRSRATRPTTPSPPPPLRPWSGPRCLFYPETSPASDCTPGTADSRFATDALRVGNRHRRRRN